MKIKEVLNDIFYEPYDWRIAIRNKKSSSELIPKVWNRFNEIKGTDEYSFADPLLYEDERGTFLFVEAINRYTKKGCIGVIDLNCKKYRFTPIITEDFHMSFPFVFSRNGKTYMIPETSAANKIILYEAKNYPYQWQYHKTLLEIKAVDTVVYQSSIDKKTKIITTKKENGDKYITQLYDFDIDNLKLTIVFESTDTKRENRGAGFVLTDEKTNKNYRVTQNCNGRYGKNLIFWEIQNDVNGFLQQKIKNVLPSDISIHGVSHKKYNQIHTYSVSTKYECIDFRFSGCSFGHAKRWCKSFLKRHL